MYLNSCDEKVTVVDGLKERIWVHAWPAVFVFQPFHVDTDASLHDEYLVEVCSCEVSSSVFTTRSRGLSCSIGSVALCRRGAFPGSSSAPFCSTDPSFFSQPDVVCLSRLCVPGYAKFHVVFLLLDMVQWSRRTVARVIKKAFS